MFVYPRNEIEMWYILPVKKNKPSLLLYNDEVESLRSFSKITNVHYLLKLFNFTFYLSSLLDITGQEM